MASLFSTLPPSIQRRIDKAFDAVNISSSGVGGFIADSAGGFLIEEPSGPSENPPNSDAIPLASISDALRHLELPPDDAQVLAVFKNAASGWSSSSSTAFVDGGTEGHDSAAHVGGWVSREDWRSVCSVLLENEHALDEDDEEEEEEDVAMLSASDEYAPGDGSASDAFVEEDDEDEGDSEDDDEEYFESKRGPSKSKASPKSKSESKRQRLADAAEEAKDLTPRNRRYKPILETFSLFFPDVPAESLPVQRIMLKDLQRISKQLGEKIKLDEMVEMLETFSSSPDKSISLADFGKMMIATKLV